MLGIKKIVKWYLDNSQCVKNISSNEYREWINENYS